MYKKEDTNERSIMSSSTEDNMECFKVAINTLIDIQSRTIARIDKLESKLRQTTSKIRDVNDIEKTTM